MRPGPGNTAVRQPTAPTLAKYGLSADEWREMLDSQGGVCAICGTVPSSGTLHIDHRHVRGFKGMKPEERKLHVRGLVCQFDNRFILARTSSKSAARLRAAADYLEAAEARYVEAIRHA